MIYSNNRPGMKDAVSFAYSAFRGVSPSGTANAWDKNDRRIDRRNSLSYEDFLKEYLYPLKPVVIRGALHNWGAMTRWTPEFFKREFSDMKFSIGGTEYGREGYGTGESPSFTMSEYIDRLLSSTAVNPAPYFRRKNLEAMFPSLVPDISPELGFLRHNWLQDQFLINKVNEVLHPGTATYLFIGGKGSVFPVVHYDGAGTHAFLMQIYGKKEYILYSPDQDRYLYPVPDKPNLSRVNDVESPDLTRFPLFPKATPIMLVLEPGEILFIPAHWWHTARILSTSITISRNLLNQTNWHELVRFVASRQSNPLLAVASRAYLTAAGTRRFWRDGN